MLETAQNIENIRRVNSGTYKVQHNNDSEDQSLNLPSVWKNKILCSLAVRILSSSGLIRNTKDLLVIN